MSIQILGLRTYVDEAGNTKLTERFFDKNWRAESVSDLFANLDKYLAEIPKKEHYNLFYTVAHCLEKKGRVLEKQDIIPFDLDGLSGAPDDERLEKIIATVTRTLKVSRKQIGIIWSGHGLQFLVHGSDIITDLASFDQMRTHYKAICGDLNIALWSNGLDGNFDTSVWSPARLMRLPGVINDKTYKDPKLVPTPSYMIESNIEELDFTLKTVARLPEIVEGEQIKKFREPDVEGVEECLFLQHCLENPNDINEPQWYGMLSIVGRFPDGRNEAHRYSEGHNQYLEGDTDRKLQQSLDSSGPRTCKNISGLWDGCIKCPHFEQVTSPITIKGPNFIKTIDSGFFNTKTNENTGEVKRTTPNFRDLMQYYVKKNVGFFTVSNSATAMFYNAEKMHWIDTNDIEMEGFAQTNFKPDGGDYPSNTISESFRKHLRKEQSMHKPIEWMNDVSAGKINLQNGTLHLDSMELKKHSLNDGFCSVLPYAYEPDAECPRFDSFMSEITLGDKDLANLLLEYVAYSLSGMSCLLGKALIMVGDGANGKSTFTDVVKNLMGKETYANVGLSDLGNEGFRINLKGKLASFGDEVPANAFNKGTNGVGEVFKSAVTGGEISGRELYHKPIHFKNKCKMFLSCNELPHVSDHSNGLYRRMIIAEFNATFNKEKADVSLNKKLELEAPGILNRIVEAYHSLKARGKFDTVTSVEKAIEDYKLTEDVVASWFSEFVEVTEFNTDKVPTESLFQSYLSYCDSENERFAGQLTKAKFSRRMNKLHGLKASFRTDSGLKTRGYSCLKLTDLTSF